MQSGSRTIRTAFTLLELIAVLVLLGLISTIAMISVVGHLEQSELIRATQLFANADRREREAARQSPLQAGMTLDRVNQRMLYRCSGRTVDVGRRVTIMEVLVLTPRTEQNTIMFSPSGQSSTYAIRFESRNGAVRWMLVVGMTGQVLVTDNSNEVRSILMMCR